MGRERRIDRRDPHRDPGYLVGCLAKDLYSVGPLARDPGLAISTLHTVHTRVSIPRPQGGGACCRGERVLTSWAANSSMRERLRRRTPPCPAHHVVYKWDDAVAGCRRADGYPATPPQHDDEEAT